MIEKNYVRKTHSTNTSITKNILSKSYQDLYKMNLRVGAYIRVSTILERQENSYWNQHMYFYKKIVDNPNWFYINIYGDEGISGTSLQRRKGFIKMINDAEKGNLDLILTKSISRFARNTIDTITYVRKLKELNVRVYFEEEGIYSLDSKGEFLLTVLGAIAQQESENMSSHLKRSVELRMQKGETVGQEKCFGYEWNKKLKKIEIYEPQAIIVRRIFKMHLEGKNYSEIADILNEEGITGDKNGKFSNASVSGIIKNIKYKGDLFLRKKVVIDPISHKSVANKGIKKSYYVKDHHEPIISREDWEAAQNVVTERRKHYKRRKNKIKEDEN